MEHLEGLNERQKEAVLATEGPLLIVAGAGAGKTKTITHRIIHLIKNGVLPENILAITFTNKAAKEMRERVIAKLSAEDRVPFMATFHSLGVFVLREHARLLGLTKYFTILDDGDSVSLIKESVKDVGLDPKVHEPRKFRYIISKEKGNGVTQEVFEGRVSTQSEEMASSVWKKYEEKKKSERALDFDDLLLETVLLLKKYPEIRKVYQDLWQYLHVDEYQDTNTVQYELTKLLVGEKKNICVVGDTDQNIYGWRGANIKNMIRFEKDYPEAKIVFLEDNYRSTKVILEAANEIIKKNTVRIAKVLRATLGTGSPISLYSAFDENDEAHYIAKKSDELIGRGTDPKDIAVLYRANFQSRVIEEAMLSLQVPYQVLGTKFFDRKEIKDLLSYIKGAQNRNSLSDLKRIINFPTRGIGKVTLIKLFAGETASLPSAMQIKIASFFALLDQIEEMRKTLPPSELIRWILKESRIEETLKAGTADDEDRLLNLQELVSLTTKYDPYGPEEGIDKLLTDAALASDQDGLEEDKGGVRLMTVHASKGLEFKTVFIAGLEQDLFPHTRDEGKSIEEREEERRLFYVAVTRAKEKIYLSYAEIRTMYGMRQINTPSEFIYDIPETLLLHEERLRQPLLRSIYFD